MRKFGWGIVFILLFCLSSVLAIDYPIDPCAGDTVVSETPTTYNIASQCFQVTISKDYTTTSSFYDLYNKKSFDLKLYSLLDTNIANPNQKKTISLEGLSYTSRIIQNGIEFTSLDGKYSFSYTIIGSKVKAGMKINNWVSDYAQGSLVLRSRIHKDTNARASFMNTKPIIDGKAQKIVESTEINGQNEFILQTIFTGKSFTLLDIDPLYTVDYSPIPAQYLEQGNVTLSLDSQFNNITDITVGVSDNSTGTNYSVFVSSPAASSNTTSLVSANSSAGSWVSEQNAYGDGGAQATAGANDISQWWGYNFGIPTAATITNITVRLDLWKNLVGNTHFISCVNLSWNNGTTYTPCQNLSSPTTTEVAYNLSGLWGRTWTATELNNDFRVQVTSSTGTTGVLNLDWIPVTVTYTYPSANYSNGSAISGKWSVTYNPSYQYFLRVYKTTAGDATLSAYAYNSTNSISTQFTSSALSGTGWFNVNVTSLVQYMTSTLGLNFSSFRFYTNTSQSFSEEWLRAETNDTTSPTVNSCTTNVTEIGCSGSALLRCNITDNLDVASAQFQVNDTNHSTTKSGDLFSYTFSPIGATAFTGLIYDWQYVYALDILGNSASLDPNIFLNYTCCIPNWVVNYGICQADDLMLKTYSDSNVCGNIIGLPFDNGTFSSCNYCSQDLVKDYQTVCNLTGYRDFMWDDENYFSCCAITTLMSDCSIQFSPYNATIIVENCSILYSDFVVETDDNVAFGFGMDKVYGKAYLNGTSGNYSCISYIKTDLNQIIQTNPVYTKATNALLQSKYDDRQYFPADNGLVNVYWTNENLIIDGRQYIFGIDCAGNTRLRGEKVVTIDYENLNSPITRIFWASSANNVTGIVAFFIILIILVIVAGFIWRQRQ